MNVDLIMSGAMAVVLLGFGALVRAGQRGLTPQAPAAIKEPERWPRVAWIVPVTGAPPGLGERLATLLSQDYPHYQMIFAVRDLEDAATPGLARFIRKHPRARLVLAGPARTCGQKNANLLAGVKLAGEAPEILVFSDANQMAPPHFLRRLVAPLARGKAEVASGYHHLIPADHRLATLGRAVTVLTLYLTKTIPRLNQPWGGATAIRRDTFYGLEVPRLWGETVVDDVSLAARLVRAGTPVALSPGAALATPAAGETLKSWQSWLFRQWLYLKYYLPGSWLAAGLFLYLTAALTLLAALRVVLTPLSGASFQTILAWLFLAGLTALALSLRPLHPAPGPPARWLLASGMALGMAVWVHLRTCLTHRLAWRDRNYDMDWRGRVRSVANAGKMNRK
uniref:Glycosyltransferase n=1 Tax=Desulfobacca acetoxidans TaxID=60893 RepID=A0A7V4LCV4_9BACT